MLTIEKYYLWFMAYSILGWVYESTICSIGEKKFINRGFLNGPYCPIYGAGAILDILILGKISDPFLLFFLGMTVTSSLEYITSYLMEKLFHARWWDYSDRKFNINGRVCLLGAIVFGTFSVLLIKFIHPCLMSITDMLSSIWQHLLTGCSFAVFMIDIIVTLSGFAGFDSKLKEISIALEQANNGISYKIRGLSERLPKHSTDIFLKRINWQHRRMISAFPRMKSMKYDGVLTEIKRRLKKEK